MSQRSRRLLLSPTWMSCGPAVSVEWEGTGLVLCFILLPVRLPLNTGGVSDCFRARPWSPWGINNPLLHSLFSPPPLMTSSAPWPPVCSLTDPRYQQRTHTGSPAGRAHPSPDLPGMEHKKPPFFTREEPLRTGRLLCRPRGRLWPTGQACRLQEGPWTADIPWKGRLHCMVGSWRQQRWPRPGLGGIRYAGWYCV